MLPRRLTPVLPPSYSHRILLYGKAIFYRLHSRQPHRTYVQCGVFAPAAPRRAWTPISVSISGLPLSWPVPVKGLVSRYLANGLIGRSPILWHIINMVVMLLGVEPFQASTPIRD